MENANPLFAQALRVNFRLYNNPDKMARSVKKLLQWIKDNLAAQAARERGGVPQVFVATVDHQRFERPLTADGGVFIVLVRPPGDWAAVAPVSLAFSFRDLYMLGYQADGAGGIWRLYNDARLIGTGADNPDNAAYWEYLPFSGGYNEQMHGVPIGMQPMYHALHTINNPESPGMAVRLALGVYVIVISEGMRFPVWKRYLVGRLRQFEMVILINQDDRFDESFTNWSNICKRVRRGPAAFVPGDGFDTYKDLIESVHVLLSRPPANEL